MSGVEALMVHIRAHKLPMPIPEYRFHETRQWRLDLAYPEYMIAIEVHGGAYSQGRHTRGAGFTNDREKMNEAMIAGWRVLEVTTEQVKSGQAIAWLEKLIRGEIK